MGKLLRVWLGLLKDQAPHYNHPTSIKGNLKAFEEQYKENKNPQRLMLAFNDALAYGIPIPQWVIEGLDKTFDKYRPLPKDPGMKWLTHREVMSLWKIDQDQDCNLKLARHIWNDGLGYYIALGKWLSEEAQAVWEKGITTDKGKRVDLIIDGWTYIDRGEITFAKIVENLSDLAFSMEEVSEFETKHLINKPSSPGPLPVRQEEPKAQNIFRKTDSGWEIVFNGKPFGNFNLEGFEYLHFYLEKSPMEYSGWTIDLEVNANKKMVVDNDEFQVDFQKNEDGDLKIVGLREGNMSMAIDRVLKMDKSDPDNEDSKNQEWFHKLRNEPKRLKFEEQRTTNKDEALKLRQERETIEEYIIDCEGLFPDEISKINDKIRKSIERAIKELQRMGADEFIKHLDESFGPRYKGKSALLGIKAKGYKPNPPIKWDLG